MKKILKKIFPIVWLKKAFLIYNQIKSGTFDKIFFKQQPIASSQFVVNRKKNPFLELNIDTNLFQPEVREGLKRWSDPSWTQDEYVVMYDDPGFIDGKTGWGISLTRNLIYPSLGFSTAPHVHKPSFIETYFGKGKITDIEKVISLRDTGEENYFHFFNDVLPKLFILEENQIRISEYVIVISKALFKKSYFQHFLEKPFLSQLSWHVQEPGEWIRFKKAIFCKPYTHTKKYYDKVLDMVRTEITDKSERRIFLTRSATSLRFIENENEIWPVLEKYNFERIDASGLGVKEQIQLFSECRYLVAIHGAGITNMIFRGDKPLSVLEIVHPFPYIPFHYVMICKMFGHNYDVLMGTEAKKGTMGGFRVGVRELEKKLTSWFE